MYHEIVVSSRALRLVETGSVLLSTRLGNVQYDAHVRPYPSRSHPRGHVCCRFNAWHKNNRELVSCFRLRGTICHTACPQMTHTGTSVLDRTTDSVQITTIADPSVVNVFTCINNVRAWQNCRIMAVVGEPHRLRPRLGDI